MTLDFPVRLTHRHPEEPAGLTKAWLLPGGNPQTWLRTLCAANFGNLEELALFATPLRRDSREPGGLFVPTPVRLPSLPVDLSPKPLPFTLTGNRLFIPADARLRYPLTEAEFSALFLHDVTVYLPATGLVGFDAGDAIRLADLIALPEQRGQLWNLAHPGLLPLPDKLTIIAAQPPPDIAQLMEQSRSDIGRQSVEELPGFPGEPKESGATGPREAFYKAVRKFTQKIPDSSKVKEPTWANKLEDWANRKLADLQAKQNREIDRLLHWLQNDPDKGLRHALPIGGDGMRGVAPPDANLGTRDVDFDLNKLGGGEIASPWALDWPQTQRLIEGYRQAANRELNLGRHRRAAYIFARLLGDHAAAANALKSGGFYREAAQLYAKFLHDEPEAALCLRQGGLFEEALQLYERLREFETMGDLYRELNREPEAERAYERAVAELTTKDEPIYAASLLAQKLDQRHRAFDLLLGAWPSSRQASEALVEFFALCKEADDAERAQTSLEALRDAPQAPGDAQRLAQVFATVSRQTWAADFREMSRDAVRVVAGRHLSRHPAENARPLTKIVASLDEDDRLLKRDARRFRSSNRKPSVVAPPVTGPKGVQLTVKSRRRFMPGFICREAAALRDGFIALGQWGGEGGKIHAVRHSDNGAESYVATGLAGQWRQALLAPDPAPLESQPAVHLVSHRPFPGIKLEPDNSGKLLLVKPAKPGTLGLAVDGLGGRWELRLSDAELVLQRCTHADKLTATHHIAQLPSGLTPEAITQSGFIVPMAVSDKCVRFALGNQLGRFDGSQTTWTPVPGMIRQLTATQLFTRPRLAIAMDDCAGMIWEESAWQNVHVFAENTSQPRVAFTRSGYVAAVDEERLRVFAIGLNRVEFAASAPNEIGPPVAVLHGSVVGQFRLITESEIVTYELS